MGRRVKGGGGRVRIKSKEEGEIRKIREEEKREGESKKRERGVERDSTGNKTGEKTDKGG